MQNTYQPPTRLDIVDALLYQHLRRAVPGDVGNMPAAAIAFESVAGDVEPVHELGDEIAFELGFTLAVDIVVQLVDNPLCGDISDAIEAARSRYRALRG